MRLVFVHGMRQEGKDPKALLAAWEGALQSAWAAAGLTAPAYEIAMPYYGDALNTLVEEVRGNTNNVVARGSGDPRPFTKLEEGLIREMAAGAGISDSEVQADLGSEVVARSAPNWEWVQAMGRVLERKVPALGRLGLGFVRQVDGYLTRPHIRKTIDDIVRPAFSPSPMVIVAHSLGTIVSYQLLRNAEKPTQAPLFVTLGSPLGIETVKAKLDPRDCAVPKGVARWLNGTDDRDYVALSARLDRDTFCAGIENLSDVHNPQKDAHSIIDYLKDATVARRIHQALA